MADPILNTMDPISLAEMDSHALMNRVDTKYVLNAGFLPKLLTSVGHAFRVLTVESIRLSPYRTLYFDTLGHDCFLQHHNGKLNRRKYRIREYQSSAACFLEVKAKNNKGRTDKRRMPLNGFEDTLSLASQDFVASVTGTLPELRPQLWSYFSRITLVNRCQPERVTLDVDLEFSCRDVRKGVPGLAIVEVKQQRDNRHSPVREYLRRQRIRPMRMSKYCLGTTILKPHLKCNRFKSKLIAIRKITSRNVS